MRNSAAHTKKPATPWASLVCRNIVSDGFEGSFRTSALALITFATDEDIVLETIVDILSEAGNSFKTTYLGHLRVELLAEWFILRRITVIINAQN